MRLSTIILTLLLAVPLLAWAAAPESWYVFYRDTEQCELMRGGPAEDMARFDKESVQYTMEDVMEQGQLVQTTLRYWSVGDDGFKRIIFYRGQARCEQAQRTKRQLQEQRREKYR